MILTGNPGTGHSLFGVSSGDIARPARKCSPRRAPPLPTGKSLYAALYAELLGELQLLPQGRVVRVTGAQLQDGGVEGLEKLFEMFDAPGNGTLQVGKLAEARLMTA